MELGVSCAELPDQGNQSLESRTQAFQADDAPGPPWVAYWTWRRLVDQIFFETNNEMIRRRNGENTAKEKKITTKNGMIAEALHTHSSKRVMLWRGIHTLIRHASFPSPTDVGPYNPPPKGAQRPRWHIDPGSGSDTIFPRRGFVLV
ncbi:hypothetical protein AHAS_Ahas18G0159100 [Arachis hypogaea]